MGSFGKKPFPAKWGDEGVDVSKDEFVKRIGGKEKNPGRHVGTSYDFNRKGNMDVNSPSVKKFICMVGNCSGVIDKKPKEE